MRASSFAPTGPKKERQQTAAVIEQVREQIEADLLAEMRELRQEHRELKSLLASGRPAQAMTPRTPPPHPAEKQQGNPI